MSPAGRVDRAAGGTTINVVDGGYRDNSGASTLVDLWPSIAAAATDTFGSAGECVRPIFLQIDNGYAATSTATSAPVDINQVLVPLKTQRNIESAIENAARQRSQDLELANGRVADWFQITTVATPGTSAPLGWVLSERGAGPAPPPAAAERRHHRRDQGAVGQQPPAVSADVSRGQDPCGGQGSSGVVCR